MPATIARERGQHEEAHDGAHRAEARHQAQQRQRSGEKPERRHDDVAERDAHGEHGEKQRGGEMHALAGRRGPQRSRPEADREPGGGEHQPGER